MKVQANKVKLDLKNSIMKRMFMAKHVREQKEWEEDAKNNAEVKESIE